MKRYDFIKSGRCTHMSPRQNGEWVRWEEVELEILEAKIEFLKAQNAMGNDMIEKLKSIPL